MASKKENSGMGEVSILSQGVKIEGRIYSDGNMRIDGSVIGDLIINGNLTLGESAEIKGEIKAQNITLSGSVEGVIFSSGKLVLESGSKLRGDLNTKVLVIEEGALFDGKSGMSNDSPESQNNE